MEHKIIKIKSKRGIIKYCVRCELVTTDKRFSYACIDDNPKYYQPFEV